MLYCEKCKVFMDTCNECPFCANKKIREPRENDIIFLTEKHYPYSGMLEDILNKNSIPYLISNKLAFKSRPLGGNFFVPFGAYEKAKELLEEYF